jgi:tetratricopeptide (TPR) repeat protein
MSDRLAKLLKILAVEPTDAFTLYGVAQEYAKAGDAPRAIEHYDRCLAADADYCYAYYHKAKTQADADDQAAAIATIKAGMETAKRLRDEKALSELSSLLDSLT